MYNVIDNQWNCRIGLILGMIPYECKRFCKSIEESFKGDQINLMILVLLWSAFGNFWRVCEWFWELWIIEGGGVSITGFGSLFGRTICKWIQSWRICEIPKNSILVFIVFSLILHSLDPLSIYKYTFSWNESIIYSFSWTFLGLERS